MKTMRYRIRVVVFALVASLFAVTLWTVKAAWIPSGNDSQIPAETLSVSPLPEPDPWASPVPATAEAVSAFPDETEAPTGEIAPSSPEPLFDTSGL